MSPSTTAHPASGLYKIHQGSRGGEAACSPAPGPVLGLSLAAEDAGRGCAGARGPGGQAQQRTRMQAPPPGARSWAGVCGLESVTVDPVATRATVTQAGSESSGLRARGAASARWALWARTPRCFQPVRGRLAGGWALRHTSAAPPAPSALSGAALPCSALLPAGPPGMRVHPVCEGLPSALLAGHCVSEGAPRGRGAAG